MHRVVPSRSGGPRGGPVPDPHLAVGPAQSDIRGRGRQIPVRHRIRESGLHRQIQRARPAARQVGQAGVHVFGELQLPGPRPRRADRQHDRVRLPVFDGHRVRADRKAFRRPSDDECFVPLRQGVVGHVEVHHAGIGFVDLRGRVVGPRGPHQPCAAGFPGRNVDLPGRQRPFPVRVQEPQAVVGGAGRAVPRPQGNQRVRQAGRGALREGQGHRQVQVVPRVFVHPVGLRPLPGLYHRQADFVRGLVVIRYPHPHRLRGFRQGQTGRAQQHFLPVPFVQVVVGHVQVEGGGNGAVPGGDGHRPQVAQWRLIVARDGQLQRTHRAGTGGGAVGGGAGNGKHLRPLEIAVVGYPQPHGGYAFRVAGGDGNRKLPVGHRQLVGTEPGGLHLVIDGAPGAAFGTEAGHRILRIPRFAVKVRPHRYLHFGGGGAGGGQSHDQRNVRR